MLPEGKTKVNVPLKDAEIDSRGLEEIERTLREAGFYLDFPFIIAKISPEFHPARSVRGY